jgi:hypothetical protein
MLWKCKKGCVTIYLECSSPTATIAIFRAAKKKKLQDKPNFFRQSSMAPKPSQDVVVSVMMIFCFYFFKQHSFESIITSTLLITHVFL